MKRDSFADVIHSRGFTLTEIAIVLGIIGSVLGGIWYAASMALEHRRVTRAVAQINTIITNFRSIYSGHRVDFPGWTDVTAMAIGAHLMPDDMIDEGVTSQGRGVWTNSWVQVSADGTDNGIRIDYAGLTPGECSRLAMTLFATATADLIYADINNQIPLLFPPMGIDPYPTPQEASNACQINESENYNRLNNFIRVMYEM